MAEALYRKYRPQVFEDVVGQNHIERTLKNAIDQGKVSHAYLFCGPRGTGKTTTARLLAKALLCDQGPTSSPDGTCQNCVDVAEGQHPDVYELDAASRTGVENVREEIIGRVNFAPSRGSKKVYIIDEVHMLSTAAFNALLKTLEEPPSHVVFVLCTTDPQKVPATIHSRCQRFDFHRLTTEEIVSRLRIICLAEDASYEDDALTLIAHRADGGMRNALTTLEQLIAFGGGNVTVSGAEDLLGSLRSSDMAQIIDAIGRRDVAACFNWVANYMDSGADLAQFARDMAEHVRNLYVASMAGADLALGVPESERRQLEDELKLFGPDRAARILGVLGDLIVQLKTAGNPRLCFEIALTRMVRPDSDLTLESLAERIEALESGKSAVATVVSVPAPASVAAPASAPLSQPAASAPVASVPAPAPAPVPAPVPQPAAPAYAAPAPSVPASAPAPVAVPQPPAPAPMPVAASPQPAVPAPAPVQATAPAQLSGDLAAIIGNPAALQRVWRSVVAAVKKEKVSYGVLFVNVRVKPEADGSGVVVEFPVDNPFAFSLASKPDVMDLISRSFQQVAGMPVPFRCVQAQGSASPASPAAPTPAPAPASQPAAPAFVPPAPSAPAAPAPAPAPAASIPPWEDPAAVQAPVPAPAPMPVAASVPPWEDPAPAPVVQPVMAQSVPAGGGYEDSVPLDAYDDVVPYDDFDGYGYDGSFDAPQASPVPTPAAPVAPQGAGAPVQDPGLQAVGAPSAQPAIVPEQPASANAEDLSKMLSSSMGVNIVFEEV